MNPTDDSMPFDISIWIDESNFVHADLVEEFKIGPITYSETTENIFDFETTSDVFDWPSGFGVPIGCELLDDPIFP